MTNCLVKCRGALVLLGDGLRDACDPRSGGEVRTR